MCTDLQAFPQADGSVYMAPCRKCNQCQSNRLNDIAGRCYAEALTSDAFYALTLTYAGDVPESQHLNYSDVQRFFKRVRSHGSEHGYRVRYLVAGEYGSKRGRAHWHCILFLTGSSDAQASLDLPPAEKEKQMWKLWPHGFTFVQRPDYSGLLYVLKYAAKDDGSDKTTRRVMMSKKPPLGSAYWEQMAKQRIQQSLPFARKYTLPAARFKNGNAVEYFLKGKSFQLAWEAHRTQYALLYPNQKRLPPISADDFDAVSAMLMHPVSKLENRAFGISLPWLLHKQFDRALNIGDGYLVRLKSGYLFACINRKGMWRSWLVQSLAEAVSLARGKPSKPPCAVLSHNLPPF